MWFLALPSLHPPPLLENVFHTCTNVGVSCSSYPCRLYRKLTLEITIATAFGHYIDIQNGEANALVEAACVTIAFLEVEIFPSVPELLLIFCKFEVPVYLLSTKCVRTVWSNILHDTISIAAHFPVVIPLLRYLLFYTKGTRDFGYLIQTVESMVEARRSYQMLPQVQFYCVDVMFIHVC